MIKILIVPLVEEKIGQAYCHVFFLRRSGIWTKINSKKSLKIIIDQW